MNSRVDGPRLLIAFVRRRVAQVAALALLGFLVGLLVVGLATVQASTLRAVSDGARADVGHRSFALQTGSHEVIEAMWGVDGAAPVVDEQGDVTAGDLATSVSVRSTSDPTLDLGVLVAGARPQVPGEVLLALSVAESLAVGPGDVIRFRASGVDERARVVGLVVNPADVTSASVIRLAPASALQSPGIWLSDTDFYADPSLREHLDRRHAKYQSVDAFLAQATVRAPEFVSASRFVPAGVGLLIGLIVVCVAAVFARSWRADSDGLVAAGMARGTAWKRIVTVASLAVLVGEVVGMAAALGLLDVFRRPISQWLGQYWTSVEVPWVHVGTLVLITMLGAATGQSVLALLARVRGTRGHVALPARWFNATAALLGAAGAVMVVLASVREGSDRAWLMPVGAASLVVAFPFLVAHASSVGLAPATSAFARRLSVTVAPLGSALAIITMASGAWSAWTTAHANAGEAASSPLEPPGSFVISHVADSAIPELQSIYDAHGGTGVVHFAIPDESSTNVRVSSSVLLECLDEFGTQSPQDLPDRCFPQESASPINTVLLGPPGSGHRADPGLLLEGDVALLEFTTGAGSVARASVIEAEPDGRLGGNLPGLVVPVDGDVARTFDLRPSGTSEVMLLGFSDLGAREQAVVRAAAIRLAPGAQTADGTDPTAYDRLRSVANIVAFGGATLAGLVGLAGGVALAVGHRLARRSLVDLGASRTARRSIVLRWTAVPVLSVAASLPVAIGLVDPAVRNMDLIGISWALPVVSGTVAAVVAGMAMWRVPSRGRE